MDVEPLTTFRLVAGTGDAHLHHDREEIVKLLVFSLVAEIKIQVPVEKSLPFLIIESCPDRVVDDESPTIDASDQSGVVVRIKFNHSAILPDPGDRSKSLPDSKEGRDGL